MKSYNNLREWSNEEESQCCRWESIFCCLVKATNVGSCGGRGGASTWTWSRCLASPPSEQNLESRSENLGLSYNGTGRIHGVYNHPRVFLVPFRARPKTANGSICMQKMYFEYNNVCFMSIRITDYWVLVVNATWLLTWRDCKWAVEMFCVSQLWWDPL